MFTYLIYIEILLSFWTFVIFPWKKNGGFGLWHFLLLLSDTYVLMQTKMTIYYIYIQEWTGRFTRCDLFEYWKLISLRLIFSYDYLLELTLLGYTRDTRFVDDTWCFLHISYVCRLLRPCLHKITSRLVVIKRRFIFMWPCYRVPRCS